MQNGASKQADAKRAQSTLPDFYICGAAKSGTTSLWRYLKQHPTIYMPETKENKEPGYFSRHRPLDDRDEYLALFENASEEQLIGEASGAYLTSPDSASRIAEAVPDAKIIIMLRNPADRAYSLYRWMAKNGYEYAKSFEEALRLERRIRYENPEFKNRNPEYYYNYLYFYSGLYYDKIRRFLNNFSRLYLHFIIFENFAGNEVSTVQEAFDFLGVESSFRPTVSVHNEGRDVKSPLVQYLLKNYCQRAVRKVLGEKAVGWIHSLMQLNISQAQSSLDPKLRQDLLDRYEEDIRRTSSLIGKDLVATWLR